MLACTHKLLHVAHLRNNFLIIYFYSYCTPVNKVQIDDIKLYE